MKTRIWIALLAVVFLLAAGACLLLYRPQSAGFKKPDSVTVTSNGRVVATLPLCEDTELLVPCQSGYNTVTVKDGKVSVTAASCPNHTCMACGAKSSGMPIICLPNRLVLQFSNTDGLDAVTK